MSVILGLRANTRKVGIRVGGKTFSQDRITYVNVENPRARRDIQRHAAIGQALQVSQPRYQFDAGVVDSGGIVTPRTGSLTLDVSAARLTTAGTSAALAAGTVVVAPNATLPQLSAVGVDVSTPGTPALAAVILNTPAATVTEQRATTLPGSLPTLPAVDTTANRTWLAFVWVPPSLTGITSVAATEVITTGSAHGFVVGDPVWFNTITGGAGIVVNQLYYVISVPSTTTFTVSATKGGPVHDHTTNLTAGTVQRQILSSDVLDIRP